MSKVPFNPRTAGHALRGLALGTSCSLILVSEERRRRLDLARTLADNGRLIKAQRCYSAAGAAAASLLVERAADTPTREGDIAFRPDLSPPSVVPARERLALLRPVPRKRTRQPISPEMRKESTARLMPVATTGLAPLNTKPVPNEKQNGVPVSATGIEDGELRALVKDIKAAKSRPDLPPEFLESATSVLRTLEQEGNMSAAQMVIDELCHHPAIHSRHFESIDAEFFLRCVLSGRDHAGTSSRPDRRLMLAVFRFWAHRKLLTSHEEISELMEMMAELFAAEDAKHAAQIFLTASHGQVGCHMTSKLVVLPVAYLYRKHGMTATLGRWMELAEKASVPMSASHNGAELIREWEFEDAPEEARSPKGRRILELSKELRRPLSHEWARELRDLNEEQRGLFDRMDEKAKDWEWEGVLGCYSEGFGAGVGRSAACLRLAVEAAVGLEDIHSPKALKLIEEAHGASVNVDPVVQSLILSRFDAILNDQKANHTPSTRGQAFKNMLELLDTVRPYYNQPSEIVYNRAIRVGLKVSEVDEAGNLCLRLARDHWDNDALYKPTSFANLVSVAMRKRDFDLLQKLLETLPWKPYRHETMCKDVLKRAQSTLLAMSSNAETTEEWYRYQASLASVRIALQSVLQARSVKHRTLRAQIKHTALRQFGTRKESGGERDARAGDKSPRVYIKFGAFEPLRTGKGSGGERDARVGYETPGAHVKFRAFEPFRTREGYGGELDARAGDKTPRAYVKDLAFW